MPLRDLHLAMVGEGLLAVEEELGGKNLYFFYDCSHSLFLIWCVDELVQRVWSSDEP
jgi:hypothetical protein